MDRIRELRTQQGLTQAALGLKVGVNQTAIGKYERGELEPSVDILKKLSAIFECSIDYLTENADDFGVIQIQTEKKSADNLSTDEMQLIQDYRALTPALQEMLQATIQTWKGMSDSKTRPNRA